MTLHTPLPIDTDPHVAPEPTTVASAAEILTLPITHGRGSRFAADRGTLSQTENGALVIPLASARAPATSETATSLRVIGGFELQRCGQPVRVSPTGQRLLALLVCHDRRMDRSRVAGMLWPDVTEARCRGNLRTVVYRLQRFSPGLLVNDGDEVSLLPEIEVDLEMLTSLAQSLLDRADEPLDMVDVHRHLLGDVLPAWDEDWLDDVRFRFRQLRLAALECLAHRLIGLRRYPQAMEAALAAVQADPLRETAHEAVIRVCVTQGNRNDALRHFQTYRCQIREELGLDPSERIQELLWTAV